MTTQLSEKNRKTLMIALNKLIEEMSDDATSRLLNDGDGIFYPPNGGMTDAERAAASRIAEALKSIPDAEMVLRKTYSNTIGEALFTLLNWIDGTEDPSGSWSGVDLVDASGEDKEMLHDALLDAYWEWKKLRPAGSWSLDRASE